jgi:hypothetical protein
MNTLEHDRRLFRRKKAAQAWWIIVVLIVLVTSVGLFSDSGAARVEKIGGTLGMLMAAPVGILLGYMGFSAWEARSPNRDREG